MPGPIQSNKRRATRVGVAVPGHPREKTRRMIDAVHKRIPLSGRRSRPACDHGGTPRHSSSDGAATLSHHSARSASSGSFREAVRAGRYQATRAVVAIRSAAKASVGASVRPTPNSRLEMKRVNHRDDSNPAIRVGRKPSRKFPFVVPIVTSSNAL